MNITLDIPNFQLGYLYFLNPKQNIIMDGTFSKIIYSNEHLSLNSIYLHLPLEIQSIDKTMNKNIAKIASDSNKNLHLIQELIKIENRIIEYYKQTHPNKSNKSISTALYKQLSFGALRLYKDFPANIQDKKNMLQFILKISGIWESQQEIGITYKIMEIWNDEP
jgi:hypothetical protein